MQTIPVFVISLASAVERRAQIRSHLGELGVEYEIVDAVRGTDLDPNFRKEVNPDANMSPGALGCYLSHIKVYERMVREKLPAALVLEDDTVLHQSVRDLVCGGCQSVDFDYCFLVADDRGDEGYVFYDANAGIEINAKHIAFRLSSGPYCTNAYLISHEGARKRTACAFPARTPIDHYQFLPYKPRFFAIIPTIAFMSEQSAVASITSAGWTEAQKRLRKYWWYYTLRDALKIKYFRKLVFYWRSDFRRHGRWRPFRSAVRVVPKWRLKY